MKIFAAALLVSLVALAQAGKYSTEHPNCLKSVAKFCDDTKSGKENHYFAFVKSENKRKQIFTS